MAHLFLLRHAKSDWGLGLPDHDRPLNSRGREAAAAMGRYLASESHPPELVICSTAQRARETLEILQEAGSTAWPVEFEPALYGAGCSTIFQILRHTAPDCRSVLLVGHNPGFHETALTLATAGPEDLIRQMRFKYPTGAFCAIRLDGATMADADFSAGTLEKFVRPRDLA